MQGIYQDIQEGRLKPVYMLYGEETWLIEQALAALQQYIDPQNLGWQREVFDGEEASPGVVAAAAAEGSMFGGMRLVLARSISWQNSGDVAPMLAYIDNPNPDTCVVLTAGATIDKRRKLVQQIQKKGRLCPCHTPKGAEKDAWLQRRFKQKGLSAQRQAIAYINICTSNLWQMAAEVDKLALYCQDSKEVTLADAEAVVAKNTVIAAYDLTDAAGAKNPQQACACYRQLLLQGEDANNICALLASQFRNMLLIQDMLKSGYRDGDIVAQLSLHPYVVEKCRRAGRGFTARQMMKALEILLAADIAQKTGRGNMEDMLETAILRICAM